MLLECIADGNEDNPRIVVASGRQYGYRRTMRASPKLKRVDVPLLVTFVVKRLEDDPENSMRVYLIGTMIQRVLYGVVHDHAVRHEPPTRMFDVRLNGAPMRVVSRQQLKNANCDVLRETSSFVFPMRKVALYARLPFEITAVETLIEFTSFTHEINGARYKFRPQLMCHTTDMRNLLSVPDWRGAPGESDGLDSMRVFDVINPSPSIEYLPETKTDACGLITQLYVPKVRITFFLDHNHTVPLLNTIAPLGFCACANLMNTVFASVRARARASSPPACARAREPHHPSYSRRAWRTTPTFSRTRSLSG